MAACHPRPAVQHLQLQEPPQLGLGSINGIAGQGQKPLQQAHYSPHLLNWVYLTIADQNHAQQPDQVLSASKPSVIRCFVFLETVRLTKRLIVNSEQAPAGDLERVPFGGVAGLLAQRRSEPFRRDRGQLGRQHRRARGPLHGAGFAGAEADQEAAAQLPLPPVLQEGPLHQGLSAGVYAGFRIRELRWPLNEPRVARRDEVLNWTLIETTNSISREDDVTRHAR